MDEKDKEEHLNTIIKLSKAILSASLDTCEKSTVLPKEIAVATLMAGVTMVVALGMPKDLMIKTVGNFYDIDEQRLKKKGVH